MLIFININKILQIYYLLLLKMEVFIIQNFNNHIN